MLKFKLSFLVFYITLFIVACSSSSTNSDPPEEPIEPTAVINNPLDGDVLEGEITFAIAGEAENGFDQARLFVGDELLETVNNPSLPFEQTIPTFNFDNGDYDLRVELDVAGEDTTISASISVTLENYFVELQTDGFITSLADNNDAAYMYIADPAGNGYVRLS